MWHPEIYAIISIPFFYYFYFFIEPLYTYLFYTKVCFLTWYSKIVTQHDGLNDLFIIEAMCGSRKWSNMSSVWPAHDLLTNFLVAIHQFARANLWKSDMKLLLDLNIILTLMTKNISRICCNVDSAQIWNLHGLDLMRWVSKSSAWEVQQFTGWSNKIFL